MIGKSGHLDKYFRETSSLETRYLTLKIPVYLRTQNHRIRKKHYDSIVGIETCVVPSKKRYTF